ncbi:MAG: hypothetical protein K2X82_16465, partial [Gemmataceae bacterium]|nr:hypothetical protein [Gemmataceae bacterium]
VAGPVPPAVSLLACGAVPAMTRWLYLVPAGLLAAGLVWAADPPLKPPPVPQPPAALLKPDPTAKPTPADLRGYWAAEQVVEAGHVRRSHAWRFVDDKHLVWVLAHAQPGVRQSLTTKYRYEPTADGLILHPVERWHGVERWPPKADEKPGEYLFAWDDDRAGFRLTSKTADRDSPWQVMTFRKADEPEAPVPDPLVPDALTKIDRTIKKEPEYADTPVYLLAVVGPEAKFKVWVVLAGKVLYVDRNGNGDLTEDGEAVPQPDTRSDNNPVYPAGDLTDPAGPTHTDFRVHAIPTAGGDVVAYLRLTVGGTVFQLAGPTDLRLAESPKDAQVVHFGSRVVTARPGRLAAPNADLTGPFQVKVGTPGVGPGSFAAFGWRELAEGVGPVAEFAFAPVKPGEAAKTLKLPLTRRVDACEFYDDLTVPDGVKTGLDAATVTLSFPGCPWGEVKPATCAVDVSPKRK